MGRPAAAVCQTRSLAQCRDELRDAASSFVIVQWSIEKPEAVLREIAWLSERFPAARIAVVAARRFAAYRSLAHEAGAIHFSVSPRRLKPLAALAHHHLEQVSVDDGSPSQRILARLPWAY